MLRSQQREWIINFQIWNFKMDVTCFHVGWTIKRNSEKIYLTIFAYYSNVTSKIGGNKFSI